jgi:site-specific DNA-methyltransferase (adenine-specific)
MHGANLGHVSFGHSDSGSYSRYFSLDAWTLTLPFLLVPKASKGEKDEGLDRFVPRQLHDRGCSRSSVIEKPPEHRRKNHHPTVKPLRLMQYLITLGSRPGDVVLDPFLGSGTTAVAAKSLGRRFIGIEREKDYLAIAQARIANAARVSPAPPAKSLKCASNPMRTTARPAPKPRSPAHSQ